MLARHPELGYFNRQDKRFPASALFASWLTRVTREDQPVEAQPIWDRFKRGGDDTMTVRDATPNVSAWFRRRIGTTLSLRGAPRFLAKYPRLSLRLEWLDSLFPHALFLHLQRDWRAVVNSNVKRQVKRHARGGGWFGVHIPGWEAMREMSPAEVATRQFVVVTEVLEEAARHFGGRMYSLRYDELCRDPRHALSEIHAWAQLSRTEDFDRSVPTELPCADFKWREELGEKRVESLRAKAPELLSRYQNPDES